MRGFKVAKQFFEACEAGEGWDGCQEFVADEAVFVAQSEPIVDIKTVNGSFACVECESGPVEAIC
mgnify:CR=1 FL=1|jgi:hypothetical protein